MGLYNLYDSEVTLDELKQLITDQISEKKTVDYKSLLELDGDEKKKEFLADMVSFANTDGGFIVYGMNEEAGVPTDLLGINSSNIDILKGRIESIIRDGIAPRFNSITVVDVPISENQKALVIKIPKSWAAPHMVWYKRSSKFFARNSSHGKYQLEALEIRSLILASENLVNQIRNFRMDRISKIINKQTPVLVDDDPKFVLHIIPINSFLNRDIIPISKFESFLYNPNPLSDYRKEYNFDGFCFHTRFDDKYPADHYTQIFRNGTLEILNSDFTSIKDQGKIIKGRKYEKYYITQMKTWNDLIKFLGFNYPLSLMLSILGIKGYKLDIPDDFNFRSSPKPIMQDNLILQDLLIEENPGEKLSAILKTIYDPVWNACGFAESINFDLEGKWISKT